MEGSLICSSRVAMAKIESSDWTAIDWIDSPTPRSTTVSPDVPNVVSTFPLS